MTIKTDDVSEFLLASADAMGVSCASVKDGHLFVFTRQALENLLSQITKDKIVVFVKQPNSLNPKESA